MYHLQRDPFRIKGSCSTIERWPSVYKYDTKLLKSFYIKQLFKILVEYCDI